MFGISDTSRLPRSRPCFFSHAFIRRDTRSRKMFLNSASVSSDNWAMWENKGSVTILTHFNPIDAVSGQKIHTPDHSSRLRFDTKLGHDWESEPQWLYSLSETVKLWNTALLFVRSSLQGGDIRDSIMISSLTIIRHSNKAYHPRVRGKFYCITNFMNYVIRCESTDAICRGDTGMVPPFCVDLHFIGCRFEGSQ